MEGRYHDFTLAEAMEIAKRNDPGEKVPSVSRTLIAEIDTLRKDAERYRWLRKHYGSVNFEPGDHDGMDLIFCVPQGEVSANCDKTVDALMQGANA